MSEPAIGHPGQMPFRLLLDEAIRQARRHFRAIYPSVAIPLAVTTTLAAAAQALWMSRMMADLGSPASLWAPEVYVLALLNFGLLLVAVMAMQVGVMDALTGRPVEMKRAWRFAARGRVLLVLFLSYVASVASVLCCCVPALFVVPLLSFIPPVMVEEGRLGLDSFSRSSELALYDPGLGFFERPLVKVLLLLVVGVIVSTVLGFLVAVPFQIPMWIDMARSTAMGEDVVERMPTWLWLQVPAQFLSALASAAVYLYLCFGIALLYFDSRARKEGSDLRGEIDAMFPGSTPPAGDRPF
jgi:hypothetical protein